MKKKVILGFLLLNFSMLGYAQDGYTISGKIRGLKTDRVYVVSAEPGVSDTLVSTEVVNESFVLKGKLPGGVRAVALRLSGIEGVLPILLEHTHYQVSLSPQGAMVEGEGPAQKLYKEFEAFAREYATEQNRIDSELRALGGTANEAQLQNLQFRADQAYKASQEKTLKLIRANADSYISAYVIALGMTADDETMLRSKYELLGESARSTVPGLAIASALSRYDKLVEGELAPNFTLSKPDGNTFTLHGVPAKWKLLHFWESSNRQSRQENIELVRLYLQYRPKGVEVISISFDQDFALWKNAIGLDGMTWTNGSELKTQADSEMARLYLVNQLPSYVLLDGENKIVAKNLRLIDVQTKLAELTKRKRKK